MQSVSVRWRQSAVVACTIIVFGHTASARQNLVSNGSMESGDGANAVDPMVPAEWIEFGPSVERSAEANLIPEGEGHALKAFSSDPQVGAFQDVPVNPGDSVSISASLFTRDGDEIAGDAQAGILLEFYDDGEDLLDIGVLWVLDAGSPVDTWVPGAIGPMIAPAGTVKARMVCVWRWFGNAGGAAFWDDCQMHVNGGDNVILNGDFETAGVGEQSPTGIDDWLGFNDQQKTTDASFHGEASVQIGMGGAFSGLFQDLGQVNAGDELLLTARVMSPSADPLNGTARAGIKLEFDPVGTVPPPEENLAFTEADPVNTWVPVALNTTVPDDVTVARIVCIYDPVGGDQTTGSVYYDVVEARINGGGNQAANASFETDFNALTDWTTFFDKGNSQAIRACFVGGIVPQDGFCMLKATGTSVAGAFQEFDVSPGDTLDLSVFVLTPTADALTGPGRAGIKVEWAAGNVPPDIDIGPSANTIDAGDALDVWHELSINFTMPAGSSAIARFTNLVQAGTANTGVVYFDVAEAVVLNRFDGADGDGDDDEDLRDFAALQECFTEDGGVPDGWPCNVFDFDDDGDVDDADHAEFVLALSGPNQ